MERIISNDRVKLLMELSDLNLHKGQVGTVRSSWHYPTIAYEVEFRVCHAPIRVLLLEYQIAAAQNN